MFTGIIETVGAIKSVSRRTESIRLAIAPGAKDYDVAIGGSVSIDGVCLTVESRASGMLYFTAVYETLHKSTLANASAGKAVNLERALRLSDRLDGHLVLGHVDGIGAIRRDQRKGDSLIRTIAVPAALRKFMAPKGSVAIDGMSLTIVDADNDTISISFIPHTLGVATVETKKPGDLVNLECDVLARYIERMLAGADAPRQSSDSEREDQARFKSLLERLA